MNELRINLPDNRAAFEPGEELAGTVYWKLDQPPRAVELRLFWFTRGKGTEDAGVVDTVRFDKLAPEQTRSFRFRLPEAPYSFSGKLITLTWALELIANPGKAVARREIILAPGGQELRLPSLPATIAKKSFITWTRS